MSDHVKDYINSLKQRYEKRNFLGLPSGGVKVETNYGVRWVKVVVVRKHEKEAIAFIDRTTGNIHRPLSWSQRGGVIGNVKR